MLPADLRRWRRAKGWSQAKAARWADISERTWTRYENGQTDIHPLLVKLIAAEDQTPTTAARRSNPT